MLLSVFSCCFELALAWLPDRLSKACRCRTWNVLCWIRYSSHESETATLSTPGQRKMEAPS